MTGTREKSLQTGLAFGSIKKLWSRRGIRERCLISAALIIIVIMILNQFIIEPLVRDQTRVQAEIPAQRQVLAKYARTAAARPQLEKRLGELNKMLESLHQRFLAGQTPALAAAGLQNILQKLANENEVSVKVTRVLQPKPLEMYTSIPVLIEIQARIPGMTAFLYSIENNQRLLKIAKLKIRVIDLRKPLDVRATLQVEGYSLASR